MAEGILHYFRIEARELIEDLTRSLLDLEKDPGRSDLLARCFRLAHTLKGAARMARQTRIGELAHAIEDALSPYRDTEVPIEHEHISDLLALVEAIRLDAEQLESPSEVASEQPDIAALERASDKERLRTVRIETAAMDMLLDNLSEIGAQLFPLRSGMDSLKAAMNTATALAKELRPAGDSDEAADAQTVKAAGTAEALCKHIAEAQRDIGASVERIEQDLGQTREIAASLRLVPVHTILGPLELAVREAAEALDKDVLFDVEGGNVRLEGQILFEVRDALLHVVRNAVDHGIEPVAERIAGDKPASGCIRMEVERKARRVVFLCHDDGRGVDPDAVRKAAVQRGKIEAAHAAELDDNEALKLIFRAGVSTSESVTEVSGRGVGLDVVRETAARLRGEVGIESEQGVGTTIRLEVPVSLSSLPVLAVATGGETVLFPLDGIRATHWTDGSDITETPGGARLLHEGRAVPFLPLDRLLRLRPPVERTGAARLAVILGSGDQQAAFGVDRLDGILEVMVKPLPPACGAPAAIAGATFDSQGDPLLLLDPRGLIDAISTLDPAVHAPRAPKQKLPILIIDDSLTTRMLEQSILESAGYEVDLAASGEEALRMVNRRRYGLFVVDIEMPGMNGIEFMARTRSNPASAQIPVILVTSLGAAADRRRGMEAGASAYIVKGEFDQKQFTHKVAELMG